MSWTRFKSNHLTLLLLLGAFLVIMNLVGLLQDFLQYAPGPGSHHLIIHNSTSAVLTALLTASLYFLSSSLTKAKNEQQASQLLAEKSRAQDEWHQTFDTMSDLVSVHAGDFKVVKANRALCEFLEKKPEEIIGRYCYQLFHDRDTPIDGCPHAEAKQTGHAVTMEVHDPRQGVPLLITCSPFVDEQGDFAGSVHMVRILPSPATGEAAPPPRFIPICASCKDIRDETDNWLNIEDYMRLRFNARLTHSICKKCQKKIYPELFKD
ncbi:MAG TPA: hypothetical protein DDY20_10205 [Desulfobulbaceae bacterium]|nr:hypothetical protein [Desulfobulbaceae bacterium]